MEILHYKNLELISATTWGDVYRANDPLLERTVALKIIRPETPEIDLSALLTEARIAAGLDHPNICPIHQVHPWEDGSLVMVLNWCPGGSLKDMLELGPITGIAAHEMASGMIKGLKAIHENGLLHGDLKPENILIDSRSQPRLADFGISSQTGNSEHGQKRMAGTMPYMAPEILQGDEHTVATDIWALGVLLFQMISVELPFSEAYEAALRYSIEFAEVPPLHLDDERDQHIYQVALQCLMKDPDLRPASASDVLTLLNNNSEEPNEGSSSGKVLPRSVVISTVFLLVFLGLFLWGPMPGFHSAADEDFKTPSGVAVLPFTSVGGDEADAAMARGLSQNTADALLILEPALLDWWFVPPHRIQLREIDNLTRAHGITGATYAITGRLEKPGADLYKLSLRIEYLGSDIESSQQGRVVELTAGKNDILTWQVEIPRLILQLLEAPWPDEAESLLRSGGTSSSLAFNYFLQGRGWLADVPDSAAARRAFMNSLQADSNFALGWWGAGLGDQERGGSRARQEARLKWHRSLELAPDLLFPLLSLIDSYHTSEDNASARQYLELLIQTHPEDFQSQLLMGDVHGALGDSTMAHNAYTKAMALHPGDAVGPSCLGAFLFNYFGNTEEAAGAFNQAAQLAPHDPDTLLFLGACYFANDQLAKAQNAFERSLSLERNALALEYLAIIFFYQGSYGRGAALAEELLQKDASRYEVWNLLGICQQQIPQQRHLARGSYDKAAELCRAEIQHADDRPSLWAMMGLIEAQSGNAAEATLWLDRAGERTPLSGDTMLNLADGFETLGNRDTALFWLEQLFATGYSSVAVERHPGFADLRRDSRYREIMEERKNERLQ